MRMRKETMIDKALITKTWKKLGIDINKKGVKPPLEDFEFKGDNDETNS